MKLILIMLCLNVGVTSFASVETYSSLLQKYNDQIFSIHSAILVIDSNLAEKSLSNNLEIFSKLTELDTFQAKAFIKDNELYNDSLIHFLKDEQQSFSTRYAEIIMYFNNTNWFKSQMQNLSLERCPSCLLRRKVNVTVLKRRDLTHLDTARCLTVSYRKIISLHITRPFEKILSYPCPEQNQILSTGPRYEFQVNFDGIIRTFERAIAVGSGVDDTQKITLVLEIP